MPIAHQIPYNTYSLSGRSSKGVNLVSTVLYSIVLLSGFLPAMQTQSSAASPALQSNAQQSNITIHVFKSGLFSGFAHNHIVVAPIAQAAVDPARMSAEITVITKEMKVTDPDVSQKDRTEIQTTMLGPTVLDATKFPEIRFKSSRIEQTSPQHYRVMGMLDLHGASKEIVFEVTGGPEHYHGAAKLKQTVFGMKPISMGGGSIKVKDELELEFDVYSAAPPKN
jgi:polyisoprenoid-binding protein YceI